MKEPNKPLFCPYCGCSSFEHEETRFCDDEGDLEMRCRSCGTRFALYLESTPNNRGEAEKKDHPCRFFTKEIGPYGFTVEDAESVWALGMGSWNQLKSLSSFSEGPSGILKGQTCREEDLS